MLCAKGKAAGSLKFIYSEKATKFYEIFPLLLTAVHTVKSKVKISQNFVAFLEYMNFKKSMFCSDCSAPQSDYFLKLKTTSTLNTNFH